jgi:hypothetical protein
MSMANLMCTQVLYRSDMDTIPTSKRAKGVLYLIEHGLDLNPGD